VLRAHHPPHPYPLPPGGRGILRGSSPSMGEGTLRVPGESVERLHEYPKNLTAKTAKIAKTRQLSSSQEGIRTKTFRVVPPISSEPAL